MKSLRRHRLTLALLLSALLHLVALGAPGWRVPTLDDLLSSDTTPRLEAHLAPVSVTARSVATDARPALRRSVLAPVMHDAPTPRPAAPSGVLAMPAADNAAPASSEAASDSGEQDAASTVAPVVVVAPVTPPEAEHSVAAPPTLALPRRGSIRFAVSRGEKGFVVGQSTHRWSHDGKTYALNSVTETTGIAAFFKQVRVVWVSTGEIATEGLRPHDFHTEKDGLRGDAASFDWGAMKLALSGGPQREVRLVPGAQDVLSMFYQLSAGPPVQTSGRSSIFVTTGRKLERYAFEALGEESVALRQHGAQRTLHLRTLAGEQTIDIWLGLDLRGLPLRIRYTDGKGDSFDQIAEDIEFEGMPGSSPSH